MIRENLYLKRYAHPSLDLDLMPPPDMKMVITVPAFKEPGVVGALKSLASCIPSQNSIVVVVLINQPEGYLSDDEKINRESFETASAWASANSTDKLIFKVLWAGSMPKKHAGVGLARKMAMDEAVRLFEKLSSQNPRAHEEGIIACFDADCECDANYLIEIERFYTEKKNCPAAVVYYEHPLHGSCDPKLYEGIAKYELFLRYHVNALRWAGFPHAHQTVGSCMTVRSSVYQKQGGMNKKKAGEDFYFLQKLFPLKGFGEINTTKVVPSPRKSDRVPFGTGKTMGGFIASGYDFLSAYHPTCYEDIKALIDRWEDYYHQPGAIEAFLATMPESVRLFLKENHFFEAFDEMRSSSPTLGTFRKKFFHWLNGFRLLKFIHFARDKYYPSIDIEEAATWLLEKYMGIKLSGPSAETLLLKIRAFDRNSCV